MFKLHFKTEGEAEEAKKAPLLIHHNGVCDLCGQEDDRLTASFDSGDSFENFNIESESVKFLNQEVFDKMVNASEAMFPVFGESFYKIVREDFYFSDLWDRKTIRVVKEHKNGMPVKEKFRAKIDICADCAGQIAKKLLEVSKEK